MHVREISKLLQVRRREGERYYEFMRVPSMSLGIYELPKGARDLQSPHEEDEVYYVVRGRATVRVGSENREVRPGSVIYVPARMKHRFHHIRERLTLLVCFAPAESHR